MKCTSIYGEKNAGIDWTFYKSGVDMNFENGKYLSAKKLRG